ncbi:MAG: peptidoglycan-associated lipoprotein Pal [Natronospirillum sp.]|uniref:peptidoglycan-associated lipoprotein Pal n=1 Tax=Natronospirillum sp. TaxID=2812955 RepID=UPI0025E1A17C|nr:peptidoglycan-associated lipoprotein Pal [Natronospirillum sp.]MCH8553281.1 peptidoglycan-associated lipoprotein Pal [Natronospirillum sp.]
MSKFKLLQVMLVTGTLVIAGCSSAPTDDAGMAEDMDTTEETRTTGLMPLGEAEVAEAEAPEEEPAMAMPSVRVVYFEFDSFSLSSAARNVLDRHVAYLRENPEAVIVLEGHTDERGSAEYNLALGENRAKSVQDYMNLRGVENSQMYVTSFGEMNPAVAESNEAAWARNRRVELQYQD